MTGPQLRRIREVRNLTRQQFADELGDCSASGVVKWESGVSPVPNWVEDKILGKARIEIAIEDLVSLADEASDRNVSLNQVLGEAVRDYSQKKQAARLQTIPAAIVLAEPSATYKSAVAHATSVAKSKRERK